MDLSISFACDSPKTEIATAAAISEGRNSKKSIPTIVSRKALFKLATSQRKQSREGPNIQRVMRIPLIIRRMSCTDIAMDDFVGCFSQVSLLRKYSMKE